MVATCWIVCLLQVAILFLIGQLLVADSIVVQWVGNFNPQVQAVARDLTNWLDQHPEVSVRTTYDMLFYFFSSSLMTLTLVVVSIAVPLLITRDLASNAIIVYSSKAISRLDYLLGKFGAVCGLMTLTWLGPVCVAWFVGNLLSPHWHFFWHSRVALGHSLSFILLSMCVIGLLAMGVSSLSPNTRTTSGAWVAMWLLGNAMVPLAFGTKAWLKYFSFTYDLRQIARAIFHLKTDLEMAQDQIPMLTMLLPRGRGRQIDSVFESPHLTGALIALIIMTVLAIVVIKRKAKAE